MDGQEPVYLWMNDDQVELRPAKHLWGKTTLKADRMIKVGLDPYAHDSH